MQAKKTSASVIHTLIKDWDGIETKVGLDLWQQLRSQIETSGVGVILVDPFTRLVLKMKTVTKVLIHQGVIRNNEPRSAQKCTKKG